MGIFTPIFSSYTQPESKIVVEIKINDSQISTAALDVGACMDGEFNKE